MSVRFVKGGSDEARLTPIGGRVKQRVSLSDRQRQALYRQYLMGEKVSDLAQSYNIGTSTVYAYINGERQKEGKMAFTEKVIDGDKRNGRLLYVNSAKHKFEGTHLTSDGEMHRLKFTANNSTIARQKWRKWCEELDAEIEFMNMVERKQGGEKEPSTETDEEPKAVCGHPSDPIEEVRTIQVIELPSVDEIHEAQQEFDAVTTQHMEATGVPLADTSEPAYLIWAKKPEPRCYGLYLTMDAALSEIDRLNDVAKFLGNDGVFEVEEVAWRG